MTTPRSLFALAAPLAVLGMFVSSCSLLGGDSDGSASPSSTTEADPSLDEPTPSSDGDQPSSDDGFKVIGKEIVDPDGNLFVPVGANVGSPLNDTEGKPIWFLRLDGNDITTAESVAAVESWGWNTLRTNALCAPTEPNEEIGSSGHGTDEMFEALDAVVDTYTAKKIVVVIDCHDFTGEPVEVGSSEWDEVQAFWAQASDRYKDNEYVWFNHMNEAHINSQGDDIWKSQVDGAYKAFAELGTKNLLVFDLANYGQKLDLFSDPANKKWAKSKCNVVWDWHAYGGISAGSDDPDSLDEATFNAAAAKLVDEVAAAEIPIMVGEFGYDWDANRKQTNFSWNAERLGSLNALATAPKHGYGLVAWHANGDSAVAMRYGLKKDDKQTFAMPSPGENLSEVGAKFWDHSQAQKDAAAEKGPTEESCTR